jgi:hypothetical protein
MTEVVNKNISIDDFLIDVSELAEKKEIRFTNFKQAWEIQSLSSEEFNQLTKKARIKLRNKSGYTVSQTDDNKLADLLIESSVVWPDLDNSKLQEHFGTVGDAAGTARAMLKPGELARLNEAILEINGLDEDSLDESVDEVKK